ncbi:MAG: hypothetical protein KAS32_09050 [Candidatus Peribacteraceae bacterium]|nr:hypothetical protein [Candidatus Peribacteraceae bacterium]
MALLGATIDKLLTNVSRGLFHKESDFIAEKIFPILQVVQQSGKIGNYDQDHLRIVNTVMGGRGETPRIEVSTTSSDTYYVEKHGLSLVLAEEDFVNYDKPFDAREDGMLFLMNRILLGKEKAVADAFGDTAILTNNTTLTGTDQWSDYTNSDPLGDVKTARLAVKAACGKVPKFGQISWEVVETLRYHPAILENLGFTRNRSGQLSVAELARAFDLDQLYVGSVDYNSTNLGQTDSLANVWGDNFVLYHKPLRATKREQSLGFLVHRKDNRKVYRNSMINPPESEIIQVIDNYDFVVTDVNCAYLIKDVLA